MIPEAFTYERATSIDDALRHMAAGALPLAGGHSLIPALRLRLSAPEALVDIARIPELSGISRDGDELVIGATTRHQDVIDSAEVRAEARCLLEATHHVGDQQVRNRGTIGGSLAQADPHGDLPAVALALGATIVLRGPSGERRVAADDFFVDHFTTARGEDELLVAVRIPAGQSSGAYEKFNRREMDWALVGCAVSQGASGWRVALAGVAPTAVRARAVEDALTAGASIEDAAARAGEGLDPQPGLDGSAEYKRHLACVMARRALARAMR